MTRVPVLWAEPREASWVCWVWDAPHWQTLVSMERECEGEGLSVPATVSEWQGLPAVEHLACCLMGVGV
jgi:hypothetical protein